MPAARENDGCSLAMNIHKQRQASDDRSSCLKNPRPAGAESSLTERTTSPFQTEPRHYEEDQPQLQHRFSTLPNSFQSVFRVLAQPRFLALKKGLCGIFLPPPAL